MEKRQADQRKWTEIVEKVRSRGASPHLIKGLEDGAVTFTVDGIEWCPPAATSGGLMVSGPTAMRSFSVTPSSGAKLFHELTPIEKHELLQKDPKAYRELRDTPETHDGKAYDDMTESELAALYRADQPKFCRMSQRSIVDETPARPRFAPSETLIRLPEDGDGGTVLRFFTPDDAA